MARDAMQTVARLRALREDQARAELVAAAAALEHARAVERAALAALRAERPPATGLDGLLRERTIHVALRDRLEHARGDVAAARREHAAATARWRQRRADQRAVERLLERRHEAARAAADAAEQAALDELAIVLHDREGVS